MVETILSMNCNLLTIQRLLFMHDCPEQMHIIEFNRFRFRARSSSHRFWFGTNISGGRGVSPSASEKMKFLLLICKIYIYY